MTRCEFCASFTVLESMEIYSEPIQSAVDSGKFGRNCRIPGVAPEMSAEICAPQADFVIDECRSGTSVVASLQRRGNESGSPDFRAGSSYHDGYAAGGSRQGRSGAFFRAPRKHDVPSIGWSSRNLDAVVPLRISRKTDVRSQSSAETVFRFDRKVDRRRG